MRWSMIEQIYGPTIGQNPALAGDTEGSRKRLKELHNRVVEHVSFRADGWMAGCWAIVNSLLIFLLLQIHRTFVLLPNTTLASQPSA